MFARSEIHITLPTAIMALMVVIAMAVFAAGSDTVYVNGVQQGSPPSMGTATNIAAAVATNVVDAKLVGNVFSSSGITNAWTGTQAAYDAIAVKDAKTLYFIKE